MARGLAISDPGPGTQTPSPEPRVPRPGSRAPRPASPVARRLKPITVVKPLVFAAALIPAARLVVGLFGFFGQDLTANPGDYITDQTGTWALAFLFISLSITPLRRFTRWNDFIKLRRMLGLFAFFYATLHMLTWVVFINFFDVGSMFADVFKRPFITVGMTVFLILFVLALTSNRFAIRRLGRKWQTLHRIVYAAAVGAVIHFWWLVKADTSEPIRWAMALTMLLGIRVWWTFRKRSLLPS